MKRKNLKRRMIKKMYVKSSNTMKMAPHGLSTQECNAEDTRFTRIEEDILAMYGNSGETGGTGIFGVMGGNEDVLPSFSEELTGHLPNLMERIVELADNSQQADVYILSALAAFSSCMTNCIIRYNRKNYYPSLMVIVTGDAASGKSSAHIGRYLVKQVNDDKQKEGESAVKEYENRIRNGADQNTLKKPKKLTHMLPADSSSAAFDRTLIDNDGCGFMESTELDTMTRSFHSEHGDFSVTLRKAYEHETIEFNRVTDYVIQKVENPRFSAILAGTPEQVSRLIPTASDGTFSRFLYYCLPPDYNYRVNLDEDEEWYSRKSDEEEFTELGKEFYEFWLKTKDMGQIRFLLSSELRKHLQTMMQTMQDYSRHKKGNGTIAAVHRLGSMVMKITAALTYLRHMGDPVVAEEIQCEERDFNNALIIAKVALRHTLKLYGSVVRAAETMTLNLKGMEKREDVMRMYDSLPDEFTTSEFNQRSQDLSISPRTTEKWLSKWVTEGNITKVSQGKYRKR